MEEKKAKKPIFKRWWFWVIIGIIVIGIIGGSGGDDNNQQVSAPPEVDQNINEEPRKEEIEVVAITADELYAAYDKNEVAADEKYKNKTLEIAGTIRDIGKDITDTIYITLETGDLISSVQCFFNKSEADFVANLNKGQRVTIVGKCTGQTIGNVIIKDSKIK